MVTWLTFVCALLVKVLLSLAGKKFSKLTITSWVHVVQEDHLLTKSQLADHRSMPIRADQYRSKYSHWFEVSLNNNQLRNPKRLISSPETEVSIVCVQKHLFVFFLSWTSVFENWTILFGKKVSLSGFRIYQWQSMPDQGISKTLLAMINNDWHWSTLRSILQFWSALIEGVLL